MSTLKESKDMKEMKEGLQNYLLKVVDEDQEDEEKGNDKKIKTYILESNISSAENITHFPKYAKIKSTDNPNLKIFYLGFRHQLESEIAYLDSSDSRFWLLHSSTGSKNIQQFVNELVLANNSQLDFAWFASNFLENKCAIGIGEGFGLKYENSFIENGNSIDENTLRRFSMLFWGGRPTDVLTGLKNNPGLVSGVNLSRMKQIFKTDDGYVKESISRDGKFTLTKGDSIDSHLLAVDTIKNRYSQVIQTLERDYRINISNKENGYNVKGTYSVIILQKKIENVELFLNHFISGNQPFRIFGLPKVVTKNFASIFAIDLHTYHKFNMEITQDSIRVYLYKNSCGNLLTRLMTNLQQYYDSQTKLMGCDDEQLI